MTVNVSVKLTHTYGNTNKKTEVGAVVFINPETKSAITGVNYFIVIDNSPSMMKDGKIEKAIDGARQLIGSIPPNNYVMVATFANDLKIVYQGNSGNDINVDIKEHGYTTNLYKAMNEIVKLAELSNKPTIAFLITDGEPTDKRNPKDYEKLKNVKNLKIITIGVGKKYNERILGKIASKFNGVMYNVSQIEEVKKIFSEYAVKEAGGYNAELETPKEFIPLNFNLPITIPVLDKSYAIYGLIEVPPGKDPFISQFKLVYDDPEVNDRIAKVVNIRIERSNNENLIKETIDSKLMDLVNYYRLLNEILDSEISGKEPTKKLEIIGQKGKDSKEVISEVTRKLRNEA